MKPIPSRLMGVITWVRAKPTDERGFQVSVENLLWIIGVIALVAIVLGFLSGYIESLIGQI